MAGKNINEFDFAEFVRCPLRIDSEASYREAPELEAAKAAASWLLSEAFNDRLPTLADVRQRIEGEWDKAGGQKRALRIVPRIAKRLHDLVADHLVLHPVTPYSLSFGRHAAKGEYAVLIKARKKDQPLLLRLRFGVDRKIANAQGPDAVNICRWLHFRFWEAGLPLVRVLNYAIEEDSAWLEFYEEKVIRQYLNSAADALAEKRSYPIPSREGCASCKSEACMSALEAFPIG